MTEAHDHEGPCGKGLLTSTENRNLNQTCATQTVSNEIQNASNVLMFQM